MQTRKSSLQDTGSNGGFQSIQQNSDPTEWQENEQGELQEIPRTKVLIKEWEADILLNKRDEAENWPERQMLV